MQSRRWPLVVVCLLLGGLCGTVVTNQVLHGRQAPQPVPSAVPPDLPSYRDVVKRILPAVVSIDSRSSLRAKQPAVPKRKPRGGDDPLMPEDLRRYLEEFERRRGEGPDDGQGGFGSGFLVDPKGVVLTNFHVIGGASEVEVILQDGTKYVSKDIKGDRKTDLAIIRFEAKKSLPYLELGDSEEMEIGDRVLAFGAPFGLTGSVTSGIVSAKGRKDLRMNMYEDFLQTDAAINPGNSGGPLVNLQGKVIGINSAIKTRTGGFQGVGLAIASNLARNIMLQLQQHGVVRRGYLGVEGRDLDPEIASRLGLKDQAGVIVTRATEGAPAAKAGLQVGDVITSVAGKQIQNMSELRRHVANLPLEKATPVIVLREGQPRTLQVTILEQPEDFGALVPARREPSAPGRRSEAESFKAEMLGFTVTDLTDELADQHGFREEARGVVVTQVQPGTVAAQAGLRRGMLIIRIDRRSVTSVATARQALEAGSLERGLLLMVQTPQGQTDYYLLKAGGREEK